MTKYPDGNPKTPFGLAKPGLTCIPFGPLFEVGRVMEYGAAKYGPMNWRDDPITASTYINSALRHIMQAWDSDGMDPETGCLHLAHAVANLLIVMDAGVCKTLISDSRMDGSTDKYIEMLTKPTENLNVTDSSNPSPTADAGPNSAERELPSDRPRAEQHGGGG